MDIWVGQQQAGGCRRLADWWALSCQENEQSGKPRCVAAIGCSIKAKRPALTEAKYGKAGGSGCGLGCANIVPNSIQRQTHLGTGRGVYVPCAYRIRIRNFRRRHEVLDCGRVDLQHVKSVLQLVVGPLRFAGVGTGKSDARRCFDIHQSRRAQWDRSAPAFPRVLIDDVRLLASRECVSRVRVVGAR